jgi:hypothetical protein
MAEYTNLEKVALISQIIGGIAVVVTLVLLIFELRANTEATQALSRQSLAARTEELLIQETRSELAGVVTRAAAGESLEGPERRMYVGYLSARLRNAEEAYLQYRDGQLSEEYWRTRANSIALSLRDPLAQQLWKTTWRQRELYTDEFSQWVDRTIDTHQALAE